MKCPKKDTTKTAYCVDSQKDFIYFINCKICLIKLLRSQ